jgi:hypothetical protein
MVASLHQQMDDERFGVLWQEGATMPLAEVVTQALSLTLT